MKNDDKSTNAAAILSVVYLLGIVAIAELMDRRPMAFWICVIWTLLVIVYVLVHDYVLTLRDNYHKLVKAVYQSEMRSVEEYKRLRGEKE